MSKRSWTDDQLKEAVVAATSIRQVLVTLKLAAAGGNYASVQKRISFLGLDTSHFLGQASQKGKVFQPKRPIQEYFNNSYPIKSFLLKTRLFREKLFSRSCSMCLQDTWLGSPIPLELDHIDGNPTNNNLENLRILCPNCHALTPTYRGKNQKRAKLRSALAA